MRNITILMIGSDLQTNGGIASVVKCYHKELECNKSDYNLDFTFLRTYYYKDKGLLAELFIFVQALLKCLFLLAFKPIDIVHIHASAGVSFYRKSFFVLLAKLFRKRIIFHIHASQFYKFYLTDNPRLAWLIGYIFSQVDTVVALCHDWEQKLLHKYPNIHVRTIHNPVDLAGQKRLPVKPSAPKKFTVVFVGFLIPTKGIHDLLTLTKLVYNEGLRNIKFIVAGKGELEYDLLDHIEKYNLAEVIEFKGWVTGEQKSALYQSADLFILPSYNEGMPMSILEAMSHSLPILSTNIAGIPDIVNNGVNGYLVKPGDVSSLYNHIVALSKDAALCNSFRESSRLMVQDFNTPLILKRVEKLYCELLELDVLVEEEKKEPVVSYAAMQP